LVWPPDLFFFPILSEVAVKGFSQMICFPAAPLGWRIPHEGLLECRGQSYQHLTVQGCGDSRHSSQDIEFLGKGLSIFQLLGCDRNDIHLEPPQLCEIVQMYVGRV